MTRHSWFRLFISLLATFVTLTTGCARFQRNENEERHSPPASIEPAHLEQPPTEAWSALTVRPGSLLNVRVYVSGNREVDISGVRVSDNGTITLPLIGSVHIGGRPLRVASLVTEIRYRNYFVNPQVSIDIVRDDDSDAFPWGFVTVLGRVKQPGRVSIPPTRDLTVSSAVQQAGGFDTSARITAIRVTRRAPDGTSQTFDVNMRNIGRRGRADEDIRLLPNDVVFVPELLF